jgi:hypothetical protein
MFLDEDEKRACPLCSVGEANLVDPFPGVYSPNQQAKRLLKEGAPWRRGQWKPRFIRNNTRDNLTLLTTTFSDVVNFINPKPLSLLVP